MSISIFDIPSIPERKITAPKNGKKQRKRNRSRAYRFALTAARKDNNVRKSSKGVFQSVADLLAGKRTERKEVLVGALD